MSTPARPPNAPHASYTPGPLGGGFEMPQPLPSVKPYLLRQEDFLTLRDGEMSEVRSVRDTCIGAFLVGAAAIASQLSTLEWDSALKQGRHPIFWTVVIFVITATALLACAITHLLMRHMRTRSAYSRLTDTIAKYFETIDAERGPLSRAPSPNPPSMQAGIDALAGRLSDMR